MMEHRSFPWIAGAMVLGAFAVAAPSPPDIRIGLNSTVKEDRWFRVRVEPAAGVSGLEVEAVPQNAAPSGRFGIRDTRRPPRYVAAPGSAEVSCKLSDDRETLQCRWTAPGGEHRAEILHPHFVARDTRLLGVVSDRPAAFDFLATLTMPESPFDSTPDPCRAVMIRPADLSTNWWDLGSIDALVLDGATGAVYSAAQKKAVGNWIASGGTVILTPRALALGPEHGTWNLYPEAEAGPAAVVADGASWGTILPAWSNHLARVPAVSLNVPPGDRLLWGGGATLLAARDRSRGRVLALALDWDRIEASERPTYEGLRKEIWALTLQLVGSDPGWRDRIPIAGIPEAEARHLAVYVMGFLFVSAIVLGLVNWLALRRRRRFEYGAFTIPASALLLAAAAFGTGVLLRGRTTLVREAAVIHAHNATVAGCVRASAMLAQDGRPVAFHVRAADAVPVEFGVSGLYSHSSPVLPGAALRWGGGFALTDLPVGLWTMAELETRSVEDLGGGLSVDARLEESELHCTVRNRLPFDLGPAWVTYGWHRKAVGTVAAGADVEFTIPLTGLDRLRPRRCPNCHRFHGSLRIDPLADPIPPPPGAPPDGVSHDAIESMDYALPDAHVAGWIPDAPGLDVDRAPVHRSAMRLCVAAFRPQVGGDRVDLPPGVVDGARILVPDALGGGLPREMLSRNLAEIDLQYLPGIQATIPGLRASVAEDGTSAGRPRDAEYVRYRLPGGDARWRAERLDLRWTIEPDRDGLRELTLSAFDWTRAAWERCAAASSGTNDVALADPDRFVHHPSQSLLLRIEGRRHGLGFVYVRWSARADRTEAGRD